MSTPPIEKVVQYDRLIATQPEIQSKGKTTRYTAHNGNMYTFLSKEGVLGIRLSKEDKAAFEAKYSTPPFMQYGAVMRGYVTIPDALFADTETLQSYLAKSYAFVRTLKPKPTKKKK